MDAVGLNMRATRKFGEFLRNTGGSPAVEFAVVAPVFLAMMIGTIYASVLFFVDGSLQNAVEDAARCAAVKTNVCPDNSSTQTYALSHFYGSSVLTPTFTASTASCGHTVSATASYSFDFGLKKVAVPISATSCYP